MQVTFIQYLLICPFVFFAGFVDAISGGGGLISLPAYVISGLPIHNAIATNKLSSSMGTTIATIKYAKSGYVPFKIAIPCAVFSIIGATIGSNIGLHISDNILKIIMLIVLPIAFIVVIKSKKIDNEIEDLTNKKYQLISLIVSLLIGCYDGIYGPGTGTFLILFLTITCKYTLKTANGITKVLNLSSNISSLIVFIINGKVIYVLGLVAGLFNILGNYLGTKCFDKKGIKIVRPLMILIFVIFFIKIVIELLGV